jgi:serine/threonine protein kinase
VRPSLNHPNIGTIYGLEETPETTALVLELVEGETIAARIARGRLAADESLAIIRQIADSLEAAHEQGIVHCDLKPLNIKITPTGQVKVLDFGLARLALAAAVDSGEIGPSPSAGHNDVTSTALLMGTPAYLSPEQVQGKPADRRSDVWAFGCIAWEILTGRQVFNGDSVAETLASIVRDEPDWTQLASDTQPSIRRLLRRCLVKNPRERLQHIGDARLELTDAGDDVVPVEKRPWRRVGERVAWGLALAAALFGFLTVYRGSRSRDPESESHVEIVGPSTNDPSSIAISPDGQTVAYTAEIQPGRSVLWIRRLDSQVALPLPSTDGASNPFWSPDSRAIAYFADLMLKRIDVESGVIQSLARAPANRGGAWSRNNIIIFVPGLGGPVQRIPAGGGEAEEVTPGQLLPATLPSWPTASIFCFMSQSRMGPEAFMRVISAAPRPNAYSMPIRLPCPRPV